MKREETIQAINEKNRELSTETIMFHETVADLLGLHITDHKCLDLIHRFGDMPAGQLAELTSLTTGAITGIIDRLEKAGCVKRANAPTERPRTIIQPVRNKKLETKLEIIFNPLRERMHKLLSPYSDSELAFLLNATTEFPEQTHEESKKLRMLDKN
jgi:DNA-binding MarR family transcriptional regulator